MWAYAHRAAVARFDDARGEGRGRRPGPDQAPVSSRLGEGCERRRAFWPLGLGTSSSILAKSLPPWCVMRARRRSTYSHCSFDGCLGSPLDRPGVVDARGVEPRSMILPLGDGTGRRRQPRCDGTEGRYREGRFEPESPTLATTREQREHLVELLGGLGAGGDDEPGRTADAGGGRRSRRRRPGRAGQAHPVRTGQLPAPLRLLQTIPGIDLGSDYTILIEIRPDLGACARRATCARGQVWCQATTPVRASAAPDARVRETQRCGLRWPSARPRRHVDHRVPVSRLPPGAGGRLGIQAGHPLRRPQAVARGPRRAPQ